MSFAAGAGDWVGRAAVFDAAGRFAGYGTDTRTVTPGEDGTTLVEVAFDGPFSFAGRYTIAADGGRRRYLGPLNLGVAEPLTDHVVDAHNHWPDLGLSQRFLLAVAPEGDVQLSLAVLSRGEALRWIVVGENRRPGAAPPPDDPLGDALLRPGRWIGDLPGGSYVEEVDAGGSRLLGTPAGDVRTAWTVGDDGAGLWTSGAEPAGLSGSATLAGGRALAGTFTVPAAGLRLWRRDVASADGERKAVVHRWTDGDRVVATSAGVVRFEAADG